MHTDLVDVRPFHRLAVLNSIAIVDTVAVGDLVAPTPCAGWNLRDLLAHMIAQHRGFAAAAIGSGGDTDVWRVDTLLGAVTADPAGTYADAANAVLTAFTDDAVLQASFALPDFGPHATFPGAIAIGFHFIDYVVHGWDVAASLGVRYALPDDVLEAALSLALAIPDGDYRDTPAVPFARALDAPSVTKLDRILRHLGRSPDWTPECSRKP
ncbi:TIGR03086 family metal-binding protein [Mycobacterium sp. 1423905.2]|uniref:TIGR03086 family metal-binding protein n=1 Tax=Mycobacterium sp. 1423905.2 TaxID=1856859 RepID=UPI0007FFB971|nr:TIGR03086 family metal-binding protein [Mycobacterium sp. 1423905.2]OBJ50893.1 TIGR03086 family protein [Mycobacterium sp. 1423905.2]